MINNERVAQMYQLALYDRDTSRKTEQIRNYYGKDYVTKEILKSIITGTIAYALILTMAVMGVVQDAEELFDSMDLVGTGIGLVLMYLAFMALYIIITIAVYRVRFRDGRVELKPYAKRLKRINKMYAREEKTRRNYDSVIRNEG